MRPAEPLGGRSTLSHSCGAIKSGSVAARFRFAEGREPFAARSSAASPLLLFQTARGLGLAFQHERLGSPAPASGNRFHWSPEATERSSSRTAPPSPSRASSSRCLMSSQLVRFPPVRSWRMRTSTQLPCRRSPSRVNLKSPFARASSGVCSLQASNTPVPELHRAATILALGDGAFEVTIVQRMVLDLDSKTLVMGIKRGTLRHGPGLKTPSSSSRRS